MQLKFKKFARRVNARTIPCVSKGVLNVRTLVNFATATAFAAFGLVAGPVSAGPAADRMADCLVRKTTGQDRIDLVRWIVLAYSKHPDVAIFVETDPRAEDGIQQTTGALFSRLVLTDCPTETKVAFAEERETAFEVAFGVLGEVAAEELMRDRSVNDAIVGFFDFVDFDQVDRLLAP